ncbi:methyltransferase [Ferrimonas lipolytica]|uniref:Ribosomal RNA small subunit methyltransferase C n=1 Tax=Ferrimonas lipolytica TaxID=2724191 RepID=A0A6H1UBD0_9GAMM|nr:methyltransferase [Ferrimonas lipolytica]QIZ75516.1 methyltransferase [Ferrimonas lipolytica]
MKLSNPSRLVEKNLEEFDGKHLLILNADGDNLLPLLVERCASVTVLAQDLTHYQLLLNNNVGATVLFGCHPNQLPRNNFDAALIRLPKAKEQLALLTALASSVVSAGENLFWVGENKGGIRTAAKVVKPWSQFALKLASGAHCQLLRGVNFEQQPWQPERWWRHHNVATPDGDLSLASLPGVFGHGSLDQGTALLLKNLPLLPQGRVLDFGCGDGIIGTFLAKRNPKIDLHMVDINAMAIEAAKVSLQDHQLMGDVYPSNGLDQVEGKFDLIVSNPPFHSGLDQSFNVAKKFIRDAAAMLNPGGQLIIVANHHLPYGDDLNHVFGRVNIVDQDSKFKIYADAR